MGLTLRRVACRLREAGGEHWGFQVACLEVAVRIDGGDAEAWSDLGRCYYTRGLQTGTLRMHEEAVVAFRQALNLRPDPHPSRGDSFDDIGRALRSCYQQNGDLNILDEAISCFRMAVTLSPTPHPDRARYLGNLTYVGTGMDDYISNPASNPRMASSAGWTSTDCRCIQPIHIFVKQL